MYSQVSSQPNPSIAKASCDEDEKSFVEFRRKVRQAEVLSTAMERLLKSVNFSGRVTVVVQNGRVLKSGYEEGFFRQRSASLDHDAAFGP